MASLNGLRIVVTRAAHQAEELAAPLRQLGADVILLPTIAIGPPADPRPLQEATARAMDYDWIIFTSQNSVDAFASYTGPSSEQSFKVAAIGRATSDSAERHGFKVHLVPDKYVAESLTDAFAPKNLAGKRILIPSAAVTRDVIPRELEKRGAMVTVVEAYRNVLPEGAADRASLLFRQPLPDWVLFASPSAVDHLAALVDLGTLAQVKIASIGPVTSKAVGKHGLKVIAEADPHDVNGLVTAVLNHAGLSAVD
ncbi:MAG: uroporphyrinogen-III synthase [Bryobacteraceae bacterium]